ncbi:hypothetical protein V2J09_006023 [Rumex salicifolius]
MQFLLLLSNKFEDVKGQILLKDPLPSVQEAYDEVLRVEALNLDMQTTEESAGFTGNSELLELLHSLNIQVQESLLPQEQSPK